MKKIYISPALAVCHLDTATSLLTVSLFDGNMETPQDLMIGDDLITNEDDIG